MVLVPPLSPLGSVRPLRIGAGPPGGPRLRGYICGQSPHLLGLGFLGGAGGGMSGRRDKRLPGHKPLFPRTCGGRGHFPGTRDGQEHQRPARRMVLDSTIERLETPETRVLNKVPRF